MTIRNSLRRAMLFGAVACAATAGVSDAVRALTIEEVANYTGADRQKVLLEGARKEGEISWYTTLIVNQAARPMAEQFEKRYPGIKVSFVRANSAGLLQRSMAEKRAGSVKSDVAITGSGAAYKKGDLAVPFTSPMQAGYPKEYIDPDRTWSGYALSFQGIAWNTDMVKNAEAPMTWEALLDPKWKGKMVWAGSNSTGAPGLITVLRQQWGDKKAMDYFEKLKAQGIRTLPGSIRTVMDQIIAGEAAMGVSMAMHHAAISKDKGAPVYGNSPEPVWTRLGTVHLMKGAPNPHAGMLFVDFILDPEGGQRVLSDALYGPAHPKTEPHPKMRWIQPSRIGKKEFVMDLVEELEMQPSSVKIYKDLFR